MSLDKIADFYNSGRNQEALSIISEIANPSIDVLIFKCFILNRMSRNEEAYILANTIMEKSQLLSQEIQFGALAAKVRSIGFVGKTEWTLAKKYLEKAESIYDHLNESTKTHLKRWKTELLLDKASLIWALNSDKKPALSIYFQCATLYKELGDQRGIGMVNTSIGFTNFMIGNIKEAKEIFEENLIFAHSQQLWDVKALTLCFIGFILNILRDTETAL